MDAESLEHYRRLHGQEEDAYVGIKLFMHEDNIRVSMALSVMTSPEQLRMKKLNDLDGKRFRYFFSMAPRPEPLGDVEDVTD